MGDSALVCITFFISVMNGQFKLRVELFIF